MTTYYISDLIEYSGGTFTKYYYADGENTVSLSYLSQEEYATKMLPAFQFVFADIHENTTTPFKDNILKKGVLYHIESALSLIEVNALAEAAQIVGDNEMYISILDETNTIYYPPKKETVVFAEPWSDHWILALDNVNQYPLKNHLSFANAHYSPKGQWGMVRFIDGYGFIGGSELFIETYYSKVGLSEESLCMDFRHDMRLNKVPEAEIFQLFSHLYGGEVAQQRIIRF